MKSYQITVNFISSRALTQDEKELLLSQVMVQVDEPVNAEGEDVDYTTLTLSDSKIRRITK